MAGKLRHLLIPIVMVLWGCGNQPPSVETEAEIQKVPATERVIRARELPNSAIPDLGRFKELRDLDFSAGNAVQPAKITDEGLAELAKLDLPHLQGLGLGWCDDITDVGLRSVAKMRTLTYLQLPSCPGITNAGLAELVNMRALTVLDLRGCPNITDAGIQKLAAKSNWKEIALGGCPNVTAQGVKALQAALPNAKILKDDQEWEFHAPHERSWRK